jgi:hypothetical protein
MKLYRLFRHKKYGEPLHPFKSIEEGSPSKHSEEGTSEKNNDDLHTVIEEGESIADDESQESIIVDA